MIRKEFRIILPLTPEEYRIGHLWSIAEASKLETGGGEGVEIITNEEWEAGQYTHKVLHLQTKIPSFIRAKESSGSLEVHEKSTNNFPNINTYYSIPYMKDNFHLVIDTLVKQDFGVSENVHGDTEAEWKDTVVEFIDIVNDRVDSRDYKVEHDPTKIQFKKVTGRGPLTSDWVEKMKERVEKGEQGVPYICVYKRVEIEFKWFGLQTTVQSMIVKAMRRVLHNLHRELFCWMDKWHGLTIEDIRKLEWETKNELEALRNSGSPRGMFEV